MNKQTPMQVQPLNARTPGSKLWRLHGYRHCADGFVCTLINPDGAYIHVALPEFVRFVAGREWDNNPEDIDAMTDLVAGVRHE